MSLRVRKDPAVVTLTARRAVIGIFTTTPVQFIPNAELTAVTNFSRRIGNIVDIAITATLVNGLPGPPMIIGTIEANPHDTDIIGPAAAGNAPPLDIVIANIGTDGMITLFPIVPLAPGTVVQIHNTYINTTRFPVP